MADGALKRILSELSDPEKAFEGLLGLLAGGLAATDAALVIRAADEAFARLFGIPATELAGRHLSELCQTTEDPLSPLARRAQADGEVAIALGCPLGSDQAQAWGDFRAYPLFDGAGACGVLLHGQDATERVRLARQAARHRALVTVGAQIVWTTDPHGMSKEAASWERYTGQSIEDSRGWGWLDAVHPDDRDRATRAWTRAVETLGRFETENRIRRADGIFRWFAVRGLPVLDEAGSPREWVGTCTDIDDRRRTALSTPDRFRAIFERAPIATMLVSMDGYVLDCNEAMHGMLGYTCAELRGRHINDFTHPDDYPLALDTLQKWAAGTGERLKVHKRYVCKNGETLWVEITTVATDLMDPTAGRFAITMIVDVTEQRRIEAALRDSEARFRLIYDQAAISIAIGDMKGDSIARNPAFYKMFGSSVDELANVSFKSLTHPDDLAREMVLFEEMALGKRQSYRLEKRMKAKDGLWTWADVTVSAVRTGDPPGGFYIATIFDVTARKQAEKTKEEFLSVLSHELRTPLNAIMGSASILDDELAGPLTADQHGYITRMLSGTERLVSLVDDLLDVSRMVAGRFTIRPEPMDFAMTVADAVANLRPLAEQRDHALLNEVPGDLPEIVADPQRVYQILTNLIGNAIKYTPNGGIIRVVARIEGDQVRGEVRDTGIGIAPEDVPKLFNRFVQVDMSTTRKVGGVGLGLSIVKALVETHGGTLGVESEPGRGSTFWFTLPSGNA